MIDVVRAAIAAPSLHNSQPWRLRVTDSGSRIELFADPARMLPVSDPHGRAAYLACGAALLNLRVAAAADGRQAHVTLTPDPDRPLFVARVELSDGQLATRADRELCAAIPRRHSNREPYSDEIVPPEVKAELAAAAKSEQGLLRFLDENSSARVRHLALDAERQLLKDHAYRAELAQWVSRDRHADGIDVQALGPRSEIGRDPVRDFAPTRPAPTRYADFEDQPQLAILSVRADNLLGWIAAGQSLERAWLTATCRGISLCPLTQPLETPDAWLVRDAHRGFEYPQMIMRIGYGPPVDARSPRRPVQDVVTWL
jgi:nitroreductase